MERKYYSITEIYKAKLNKITAIKDDILAKIKKCDEDVDSYRRDKDKKIKIAQDKIASVESLIDSSRREGLEPSKQQLDALLSRKSELTDIEKVAASDKSAINAEKIKLELSNQLIVITAEETASKDKLVLAEQLVSEWFGSPFRERKGSDCNNWGISGVPNLLALPNLQSALAIYFSEIEITLHADSGNIVRFIQIPLLGVNKKVMKIPVTGHERRLLTDYLNSEWIELSNDLANSSVKILSHEGDSDYKLGYELARYGYGRGDQSVSRRNNKSKPLLTIDAYESWHHKNPERDHPNRSCFFYVEDTGTAYALKPDSIERCKIIKKAVHRFTYGSDIDPTGSMDSQQEVLTVERAPSDCSSIFANFENAILSEISKLSSDGIDPDNLPDNEIGKYVSELFKNTTAKKIHLTETSKRPTSEETFNLIAAYWDALIQAPWGPEIIGTYADLKDLCLSGAKPHAWIDGYEECIGLRLKSSNEAWLVARVYCPKKDQMPKTLASSIEVRPLRAGSNYKTTRSSDQISHLVKSGPCLIEIISYPDR